MTRESRENFGSKKRVSLLARISKSDSRVNPTYNVDAGRGEEKLYNNFSETAFNTTVREREEL